jgi:(2Fe-2S) ferredoxin
VSGARCRVRVCRDCCCGTTRKHPGVDHDGLVDRLVDRVGDLAEVSVTTCLLACDRSNVVVVSPDSSGRRKGERSVWLREVLDTGTVDAIASWVVAGGPGHADLPIVLVAHVTTSPSLPLRDSLAEKMGP